MEVYENAALSARRAAAIAELPLHHRDPFDWMLVAQVLVERLTRCMAALYSAETNPQLHLRILYFYSLA
jgi:hypothetical protein